MALSSISEIIEDIRQGKMVILMDDEDRENEGDLIMASTMVRPEDINFMARYGRGLICLTLTRERCEQLNLSLMVNNNGAKYATAFTTSIEAAEGVTTGISAADRARTVQAAVASDAKPSDIVQPGHIFPLMAQPGGVLNRAGHTEAGCDLARLAGLEASSVIVEILNEDGTMARRPDLEVFAKEHGIKMGTIADLIQYRTMNEKTVAKVSECHWPTLHGDFRLHTFQDNIDGKLHFAIVKGNPKPDQPTLVRVHVTDNLADLLEQQRGDRSSWSLNRAIERIAQEGEGVVVVLANEEPTESLIARIKRFADEDEGIESPKMAPSDALRKVGVGSQILAELDVHKLRLLSPEKKYHALSGFNLEVVEYIEDNE
ncbi:bifunctional 3,4-dihydroxy-2-butanone-4-phosphate synthase/GTP cyclohydrolase II [Pleionea sp. CnH1-48]|uniref:bifunctional 3,4-dihydroxy-2-butanone-4-phosphate synthase/GTP cyclohydrolase II n=1 Tax=Pleionea sp. CnH1-48 TaxID=2954494 RepID=UPI00209715CE|nr:bifunctional 3,4-dihydroxy-2-butanone-4-phosphate synthase/GTP cyclohydrolase II [Pleionea sp. CnH1-48]MCO7225734.1 bifunctional 3,4-dihydroxy-2-butanone-4-phosphate synthase/GTP cyclohydrolase II [Pleionea sp. CnH1-48]